MKKLSVCVLLLALMAALIVPAQAKTFTSGDWQVAFTQEKTMVSNFKTSDMDTLIRGMQPGDTAIINLRLANQHSVTTDWYMTNEVLSSLEDSHDTADGGAYTYRLIYVGPDGVENVLYDSDTVGGDDIGEAGEGLNEATDSLKDFFFLDTLATGQSGTITLTVELEGETQGNGYQDTLADLQMNFAVELDDDHTTVVQTGDSNMLPYIIAAAVSGVLLLVYGVYSVRTQWQKRKGR